MPSCGSYFIGVAGHLHMPSSMASFFTFQSSHPIWISLFLCIDSLRADAPQSSFEFSSTPHFSYLLSNLSSNLNLLLSGALIVLLLPWWNSHIPSVGDGFGTYNSSFHSTSTSTLNNWLLTSKFLNSLEVHLLTNRIKHPKYNSPHCRRYLTTLTVCHKVRRWWH